MLLRLLTLVSLLFLSQPSSPQQLQKTKADDVPDTCPATRAPTLPFIPPWLYPFFEGRAETVLVRYGKAMDDTSRR